MDKLTEKIYNNIIESLNTSVDNENLSEGKVVKGNFPSNDIDDHYEVTPEHLEKFSEHLKELAKKQREIQSKIGPGKPPSEKLHAEMEKHFHAINSSGVREALRNHFAKGKK